jgi:hypothetical protein
VIRVVSRFSCFVFLKIDSSPHFGYRRVVQWAVNKFAQLFVSFPPPPKKIFKEILQDIFGRELYGWRHRHVTP